MVDETVVDGGMVVVQKYVGGDRWKACGCVHFGDAEVVACSDALDVAPAVFALRAVVGPVSMFVLIGSVASDCVPGGVSSQSCV